MLSKNRIRILNLFRKNIFLKESIRGLTRRISKSYQRVYEEVKYLEREDVIEMTRIGHSNLISLKLTSHSISFLSFLDEQEALSKNLPSIEKILSFKEFLDDIIMVTGSYASGKQTAKSDIDLVIITNGSITIKQKLIENLTALFLPKVHAIVISYEDFIGMLKSKEENYGKEIFNNRLIFRNSNKYYELLKEAIENGFREPPFEKLILTNNMQNKAMQLERNTLV